MVDSISYASGDDDGRLHLREQVLRNATMFDEKSLYSSEALQETYNKFSRLQAVKYTNIRFNERPDTTVLDCSIQISTNKPNTLSFQPEGTNTAGDLGAAASLTWENRNFFHGSELLTVRLRSAFEAITGLEGYQNQNYVEYGIDGRLQFPRFLAPFLSPTFKRRSLATSELSLGYNSQNRPEFHRRVFSAGWRYRWAEPRHHINYRVDLLDLNYVYMPWISSTFKHDYLDSPNNRNAILRYNYEDLFIMKVGAGLTYNDGQNALRANIETAGNLLDGLSAAFRFKQNASGQHTLFNIAYAQYAKFDADYTRLLNFDSRNTLAMHVGLGIAWPYGNSTVLPFEKRYFSGGANSVRGWSVRSLGPGSFRGSNGRIDFINQTGDMKLDLNLEYRTYLFWKLNGAAFVDAGNIWTLRSYAEQPGGQFKLGSFYKQIAVAYGVGLRLNFDYFVLRFDMGMKAINPAYRTQNEHYALLHPAFGRDSLEHFDRKIDARDNPMRAKDILHRFLGQNRMIILLAQVAQPNFPQGRGRTLGDDLSAGRVGQMTVGAEYSLLQMLRISTSDQHFFVVVGLNHEIIRLADEVSYLLRDVADVRHEYEDDLAAHHLISHVVRAVVRHVEGCDGERTEQKGCSLLNHLNMPGLDLCFYTVILFDARMHLPRCIDVDVEVVAQASRRLNMVGMVVRDQQTVDIGQPKAVILEMFLQRAEPQAGVYEDSVCLGEQTIAITATATAERNKFQHVFDVFLQNYQEKAK